MHQRHVAAATAALTFALVATTADAARFTREPFLQLATPNSVTVAFRTDSACAAQVRYGPNGGTSQVAENKGAATDHAIRLDGLSPATRYSYVVQACGSTLGATKSFVTAPARGTRKVRFAAMGDFGMGNEAQAQVLASIVQNKPELLLGLGDIAYDAGSEQELQDHLFTPMAPLMAEVPLFAALGNHEYGTDQGQPTLDGLHQPSNNPQRTERYYSFDWGHVHFVALDSTCAVGAATRDRCDRDAMLAWAKADLEQSRAPWKIVFFHHPLWSSGSHGSTLKMRAKYAPIFEATGVDLVLTGHDHDYERTKPMRGDGEASGTERGITYLVIGSGGARHRTFSGTKPNWSVYRDDLNHGYLDVTVAGGTLEARMVTPAGAVLDSFSLRKTLPPEPALAAAAAPAKGTAPFTAQLTATPTGMDGAQVRWSFGDGAAGDGPQVSHVYAKPGSYEAIATATGADGTTLTQKVAIQVDAAQAPHVETTPAPGSGTGAGTTPSTGGTTPSTGGTTATPAPATTGPKPTLSGSQPAASASSGKGGCQTTPGATALLPLSLALSAVLLRLRARAR
ncbi:MAG TPA: metallophosphoesterase [Myxococcaceae bacterium]|nr:metallophosphoesterase [Myxococcaceae bacterium]